MFPYVTKGMQEEDRRINRNEEKITKLEEENHTLRTIVEDLMRRIETLEGREKGNE